MAEAGLQSAERVKREIKKVRFDENLRPEDVANFLPRWSFRKFGPTAHGPGFKPGENFNRKVGNSRKKQEDGKFIYLYLRTEKI